MKKRLLSAALALAMVLTMLPLSALPAFATGPAKDDGSETATYQATNNTKNDYPNAPGWFAPTRDTDDKIDGYEKIGAGIVACYNGTSGKYYSESEFNALATKPTSVTVIGSSVSLSFNDNTTSVKVDIYSNNGSVGSATIANSTSGLTNIEVTDSKYDAEVKAGRRLATVRSTVTLPTSSWPDTTKALSVSLTNVESGSDITMSGAVAKGNVTRKITLKNAKLGEVDLNGVDADKTSSQAAQTVETQQAGVSGAPGNTIGAITLVGNSSKVTLWDTSVGNGTSNIKLTGTGTSLIVNGKTEGGGVTLIGSEDEKVTTGTAPKVEVNGGSVDVVMGTLDEKLTGAFTVTVNAAGMVDGIALPNANITVNGGTVRDSNIVNLKTGFLKISGGATVGDITFAKDGKISDFSITGDGNTVGAVSIASSGNTTFTSLSIPAGTGNTIKSLVLGNYAGHGVKGGKYTTAITAANAKNYLPTSMAYQVLLSDSKYGYFEKSKLSEAIAAAGSTNAVADGGIVLVGHTRSHDITLSNAGTAIAKIGFGAVPASITLPSVVNGVHYSVWMLKGDANSKDSTYTAGEDFTRSVAQDATLDAQGTSGVVATLSNPRVTSTTNPNVTAKLNGNQIVLSGAVTTSGSGAGIEVTMDTDLVVTGTGAVQIKVTINWDPDTKKATFAKDVPVGYGITFPDADTMRLDDGSTYTVSGSGLSVVYAGFQTDKDTKTMIDATVTDSNYKSDAQKQALITQVLGAVGSGYEFDWTTSPALRQAVNAAEASITESQVISWRRQAQVKVWQKTHSGNPTDTDLTKDSVANAYQYVTLVPYLKLTITKAKPLTMTMVPSWRVEVRKSYTTTTDAIIIQDKGSLGTLSSDLTGSATGDVGVTVKLMGTLVGASDFAYQDDTYVYQAATSVFTFTHAGKTGLGTVEISTVASPIKLTRDGVTDPMYYLSLQAAVDDTIYVADDSKWDVIEVGANYVGDGVISVTGQARTFKINVMGNTTITSNASADMVKVTPSTGHTYTIQLLKNNEVNTSITVSSNSNGTTTVSTNSARPGATVTITATPKSGYQASTPTVTTNTGATVTVSGSNGTYTFVVPAGATSITVRPNYVLSTGMPFTDVTNTSAWYFNGVKYCWDTMKNGYHLMQGYSDDEFGPSRNFTRAEMVQILYNINGRPSVTGLSNPFSDVNRTNASIAWAYDAIVWAANNGFADGDGDGRFRPSSNVSRCELVEFLWKYETKPTGSGNLNAYSDGSSVPQWAQASMRWAVGFNILSGQNSVSLGNRIAAESNALRSQVAVTMMQYYERYGG